MRLPLLIGKTRQVKMASPTRVLFAMSFLPKDIVRVEVPRDSIRVESPREIVRVEFPRDSIRSEFPRDVIRVEFAKDGLVPRGTCGGRGTCVF